MAAVPMTTIEQVKALLGNVRPGDTQFDARLRLCLDMATEQIEAFCRRSFAAEYPTVGAALDEHLDVPAGMAAGAAAQAAFLFKKLDPQNIGLASARQDHNDAAETAVRFVTVGGLIPEVVAVFGRRRKMLMGGA